MTDVARRGVPLLPSRLLRRQKSGPVDRAPPTHPSHRLAHVVQRPPPVLAFTTPPSPPPCPPSAASSPRRCTSRPSVDSVGNQSGPSSGMPTGLVLRALNGKPLRIPSWSSNNCLCAARPTRSLTKPPRGLTWPPSRRRPPPAQPSPSCQSPCRAPPPAHSASASTPPTPPAPRRVWRRKGWGRRSPSTRTCG